MRKEFAMDGSRDALQEYLRQLEGPWAEARTNRSLSYVDDWEPGRYEFQIAKAEPYMTKTTQKPALRLELLCMSGSRQYDIRQEFWRFDKQGGMIALSNLLAVLGYDVENLPYEEVPKIIDEIHKKQPTIIAEITEREYDDNGVTRVWKNLTAVDLVDAGTRSDREQLEAEVEQAFASPSEPEEPEGESEPVEGKVGLDGSVTEETLDTLKKLWDDFGLGDPPEQGYVIGVRSYEWNVEDGDLTDGEVAALRIAGAKVVGVKEEKKPRRKSKKKSKKAANS